MALSSADPCTMVRWGIDFLTGAIKCLVCKQGFGMNCCLTMVAERLNLAQKLFDVIKLNISPH